MRERNATGLSEPVRSALSELVEDGATGMLEVALTGEGRPLLVRPVLDRIGQTGHGAIALVLCILLTGCSTMVPMQTASAVDRGGVRVGGQLSAAGFCGDIPGGVLGLTRCTDYPDGVPLPELRGNARFGLGHGFDVGTSVQVQAQLFAPERPIQFGLTVDVKGELVRVPTRGPTHVLSVGLLAGAAASGRFGLGTWGQLEWAVPLFYGLQFAHWEAVLGLTAGQRHLGSPTVSPSRDETRMGFTLGLFHREPAGFAVQLGYFTDPARFSNGALQLQVGVFFDLK